MCYKNCADNRTEGRCMLNHVFQWKNIKAMTQTWLYFNFMYTYIWIQINKWEICMGKRLDYMNNDLIFSLMCMCLRSGFCLWQWKSLSAPQLPSILILSSPQFLLHYGSISKLILVESRIYADYNSVATELHKNMNMNVK